MKAALIFFGCIFALIILIAITIDVPDFEPNYRCKKFGSDWSQGRNGAGLPPHCINSNGDIKYLK
jgi:hypothetical protein